LRAGSSYASCQLHQAAALSCRQIDDLQMTVILTRPIDLPLVVKQAKTFQPALAAQAR